MLDLLFLFVVAALAGIGLYAVVVTVYRVDTSQWVERLSLVLAVFVVCGVVGFVAGCASPPHYSDSHARWLEHVKRGF